MKNPIDLILIGAGNRGHNVYAQYIWQHPDQFRLVAVADPNPERRQRTASLHGLAPQQQYSSWQDLLARPQMAQAAIIATQDQIHTDPTLAALTLGYDVLLEKPMAHRQIDCVRLVQAAESSGRLLQIAHVLRYTPVMQAIKQQLQSGTLGDIITFSHRENVSYWHMAHSYVRGNWRNADEASPMILAKCCHDLDLITWFLDSDCQRLSSVGALRHFHLDQAPDDLVPLRCTDGCPAAEVCLYEATRIYLNLDPFIGELQQAKSPIYRFAGRFAASAAGRKMIHWLRNHGEWAHPLMAEATNDQALGNALATGPYGRCVYHCDNDVVDQQVVLMEFEQGVTATLTMQGHSHKEGRTLRIDGTKATLTARMSLFESEIEVHHKRPHKVERAYFRHQFGHGHGGGDAGLMAAFFKALTRRHLKPLTTAKIALESHLLAFAAEQARLEGGMIEMKYYRDQAWQSANPLTSALPLRDRNVSKTPCHSS